MATYGYGGTGGYGNHKNYGSAGPGGPGGSSSYLNGQNGTSGSGYAGSGGGGGGGAIGGAGGNGASGASYYYSNGGNGGLGGYQVGNPSKNGQNGGLGYDNGGGGGGGAGGSNGGSGTLSNIGGLAGTAGGYGGSGGGATGGYGYSTSGGGGGGGAGGNGFLVNAASSTNTNGSLVTSATVTGGAGGAGGYTNYGNASGQGGMGGSGGDGVAVASGATGSSLTNYSGSTITGGAGGAGGAVGYRGLGGSGGVGGNGVEFDAPGTLTNAGTITGGAGGAGANAGGGYGSGVGEGAAGGAGVSMASGGTVVNNTGGTITGGNAGAPGAGGGTYAYGGAGVIGSNLTLVNSGSISGGMSAGTTPVQADAVTFTGGSNTLALGSNASFGGAVDLQNSSVVTFDQSVDSSLSPDATLNAPIIGSGSAVKDGTGTLTLTGASTYTGGTTINGGTLVDAPTTAGTSSIGTGPVTFAGTATSAATLALSANAQPASGGTFANTLTNFGDNDTLDLKGLLYTDAGPYTAISDSANSLTANENSMTESFTLSGSQMSTYYEESDGNGGTIIVDSITCYASGTQIRTLNGDVRVEELAIGDRVVTSSGAHRPIKWIGHRGTDCARHLEPRKVWPVRVAAGALGGGLPYADLWLSPGHALCLDDVLYPVRALVHGDLIQQVEQDHVTYWHVELDSHDILVANGVQAESYLDTGNRSAFDNAPGVVDLHPDFEPRFTERFCRPYAESGPLVAAARYRLFGAAQTPATPTVHLVADGLVLTPARCGNTLTFVVPERTLQLRLASPSRRANGADVRTLGVLIGSIVIETSAGRHDITLDDPRLFAGFHDVERTSAGSWRWTDGAGHFANDLWTDAGGAFVMRLTGLFDVLADEGAIEIAA